MKPLIEPPLALYVHLPWCLRKCPYCDFNSHALAPLTSSLKALDAATEQQYIAALLSDLDQELLAWPKLSKRPLVSIFFGGGTPSLVSPRGYEVFLRSLEKRLSLTTDCEITLEANPSTLEQKRFAGYRAIGINRLSIGVQSFADAQLQALGRVHSGAEAIQAAKIARQAGFTNFNLDLMHGLHEQTPALALADLQQALALEPQHLSWYQLTLEPNTEFFRCPPRLPDEDILADIQDLGEAQLVQAGFNHYEVSAYARQGKEAVHNLNYWQFGDYLGLGAGAHGKLSYWKQQQPENHLPEKLFIERRWKTRQPLAYLARLQQKRDFLAGQQSISLEQRPVEFMMNALRLREGIDAKLYTQRTGLPLAALEPLLKRLQEQGLLNTDPKRLACTPLGWRWLNSVLESFLCAS